MYYMYKMYIYIYRMAVGAGESAILSSILVFIRKYITVVARRPYLAKRSAAVYL